MRRNISFSKFKSIISLTRGNVTVAGSSSGPEKFHKDFETCHIEMSALQKVLLRFGSACLSIADPRRGDMIAAMGETTGVNALQFVRNSMLASSEGARILNEKPRITSATVDVLKLGQLPDQTVGKAYFNFLTKYNYTPDARLAVQFVDDVELAYVIQRYREVHDLFHTILQMPTNMLGEVAVKWVEGIQTRLPMCVGGAVFGATRLAPKYTRTYSTSSRPLAELDLAVKDGLEKKEIVPKRHPGVMRVNCVSVPESIQNVIEIIVAERNLCDIVEKSKDLRNYLACRKPPAEEIDLEVKRKQHYENILRELESQPRVMDYYDDESINKMTKGTVDDLMRKTTYNWKPLKMDDVMSYYYLAGRTASDYAVALRVLNEIHRRDKDFKPNNIFDFGSGIGTVSWAAHKLWSDTIKEYFTVDCSAEINELALRILQNNDPSATPFIQNLFQRQFLPAAPRQYDLVTCAYSLMEMSGVDERLKLISTLWNKTSKYLVLVEQCSFAGFQLINEARDFILHMCKSSAQTCHVFAPCPHDWKCPRLAQKNPVSCSFNVKAVPLAISFSGKASKAITEKFTYLIVARDERNVDEPAWPRIVDHVLLRHGHSVCRLCMSSGKLQEIIMTSSKHGKDAFKCSRYSQLGDLLPVNISFETT